MARTADGGQPGPSASSPVGSDGNISAAPQFVSASDFNLTQASPSVDAGSDNGVVGRIDFVGNTRVVGSIDQGAYELQDPGPVVVAPSAPLDVAAAFQGKNKAVVTWEAPTDDGGATITSYVVRVAGTSQLVTVDGSARWATLTGLSKKSAHTITIEAVNSAGPGPQASVTLGGGGGGGGGPKCHPKKGC